MADRWYGSSESQATIVAWAQQTIKSECSTLRLAVQAQEELVEALRAATSGHRADRVLEEMGDSMIALYRLADRLGINADSAASNPLLQPRGHANPPVLLAKCSVALATIVAALAEEENLPLMQTAIKLFPPLVYAMFFTARVLNGTLHKVIDRKMATNRDISPRHNGSGVPNNAPEWAEQPHIGAA